jgi:hypothetical protein
MSPAAVGFYDHLAHAEQTHEERRIRIFSRNFDALPHFL